MFQSLKNNPLLRWSVWRMAFGMKHLTEHWQVGDGREDRLAAHVEKHARRGDPADVIRVIDEFGRRESFLMNVGDEKGVLLDAALERARPARVLELGTYCGYSSLRMAVAAPTAQIFSIEFSPANAEIARRVHVHAGIADRITIVVGTLGDGGATLRLLEERHGFGPGTLDFLFIDHDKAAYLPDLQRVLERGWLHSGSRVVADNVKFPGAPEYRAYMQANEGKLWRTVEHATHVEYQSLLADLVLESELLAQA